MKYLKSVFLLLLISSINSYSQEIPTKESMIADTQAGKVISKTYFRNLVNYLNQIAPGVGSDPNLIVDDIIDGQSVISTSKILNIFNAVDSYFKTEIKNKNPSLDMKNYLDFIQPMYSISAKDFRDKIIAYGNLKSILDTFNLAQKPTIAGVGKALYSIDDGATWSDDVSIVKNFSQNYLVKFESGVSYSNPTKGKLAYKEIADRILLFPTEKLFVDDQSSTLKRNSANDVELSLLVFGEHFSETVQTLSSVKKTLSVPGYSIKLTSVSSSISPYEPVRTVKSCSNQPVNSSGGYEVVGGSGICLNYTCSAGYYKDYVSNSCILSQGESLEITYSTTQLIPEPDPITDFNDEIPEISESRIDLSTVGSYEFKYILTNKSRKSIMLDNYFDLKIMAYAESNETLQNSIWPKEESPASNKPFISSNTCSSSISAGDSCEIVIKFEDHPQLDTDVAFKIVNIRSQEDDNLPSYYMATSAYSLVENGVEIAAAGSKVDLSTKTIRISPKKRTIIGIAPASIDDSQIPVLTPKKYINKSLIETAQNGFNVNSLVDFLGEIPYSNNLSKFKINLVNTGSIDFGIRPDESDTVLNVSKVLTISDPSVDSKRVEIRFGTDSGDCSADGSSGGVATNLEGLGRSSCNVYLRYDDSSYINSVKSKYSSYDDSVVNEFIGESSVFYSGYKATPVNSILSIKDPLTGSVNNSIIVSFNMDPITEKMELESGFKKFAISEYKTGVSRSEFNTAFFPKSSGDYVEPSNLGDNSYFFGNDEIRSFSGKASMQPALALDFLNSQVYDQRHLEPWGYYSLTGQESRLFNSDLYNAAMNKSSFTPYFAGCTNNQTNANVADFIITNVGQNPTKLSKWIEWFSVFNWEFDPSWVRPIMSRIATTTPSENCSRFNPAGCKRDLNWISVEQIFQNGSVRKIDIEGSESPYTITYIGTSDEVIVGPSEKIRITLILAPSGLARQIEVQDLELAIVNAENFDSAVKSRCVSKGYFNPSDENVLNSCVDNAFSEDDPQGIMHSLKVAGFVGDYMFRSMVKNNPAIDPWLYDVNYYVPYWDEQDQIQKPQMPSIYPYQNTMYKNSCSPMLKFEELSGLISPEEFTDRFIDGNESLR